MLNPRQERFCQLYATGGNASAAYREAYSGALGAGQSAFTLLKIPKIKARVAELTGDASERAEIDRDYLIQFWREVLETPIGEIDENHPLAQEYQANADGVKVKMPAKDGAGKELARLIGAYAPDKVEVSADDALTKLLGEIREKR